MSVKACFTLNIEPFSINRMSYRDKTRLTADYREWQKRFFMQLAKDVPQSELAKVREVFDPAKHRFAVKLTHYYPVLLNKDGAINAHTEDLSNIEKPEIDLIFLAKYFPLPVPYGAPNLNTDDRHIISLVSRKVQSPAGEKANKIKVEIRIVSA